MLYTDLCDVFFFLLCCTLDYPKTGSGEKTVPKNLRGKILESVTLLGHLDNYMSVVARSGKMFVVVLTASCFRAKAVSLWNSEGNIRPKVSSLSVDKMPEGVIACLNSIEQTFYYHEHIPTRGVL